LPNRRGLLDPLLKPVVYSDKWALNSAIKHPNIVLVRTFFKFTPYFFELVIDLIYA